MKDFNPSTFYISIIDLFAILLPGSLVSMVLYHTYKYQLDCYLKIGKDDQNTFLMGFALLFSSYLFGHIISQVSAYLDEWVYDNFRSVLYSDKKVNKVISIRKKNYNNKLETNFVNTYQWSIYKLQQDYPEAASEVDRYMADSKFFRSLFVVLSAGLFVLVFLNQVTIGWVALAIVLAFVIISVLCDYLENKINISIQQEKDKKEKEIKQEKRIKLRNIRHWLSILTLLIPFVLLSIRVIRTHNYLGLACSLLAAFSMVRYFKKRRKATETAYQYIIFLEDLNSRKGEVKKKRQSKPKKNGK